VYEYVEQVFWVVIMDIGMMEIGTERIESEDATSKVSICQER
jgi:hypothetical protein